jgi:hypothetical protein
MIKKHHYNARYAHQKKNHTSKLVLFAILIMGKMGSPVFSFWSPIEKQQTRQGRLFNLQSKP